MRMLLCELNRIHSHLIWLGTSALELGAISMFWYCFREREQILDLSELVAGTRMHTRYFQAGGLAEDVPRGFYPECRKFVERMPHGVDEYEELVNKNAIWLERTQGVGLLTAGGPKPWRVTFRAPSFVAVEATATCLGRSLIADMIAIVGSLDTVMGEVDR